MSATVSLLRSVSRATITPPRSSRIRERQRGWGASSATSSPWVPARLPPWIRCGSAPSTIREAVGSPKVWCRGSPATAIRSACPPSAVRWSSTRPTRAIPWSTCSALGLLPMERLVLGRATGVGNLAVLLGSTTGRDGIGGVSVLASAGFGDDEADAGKRPSVQVGDPFEEKRLIEACLELLDRNAGRRCAGSRRRRHHLCDSGDRRQGRRRDGRLRRRHPPA